MQAVKSKFAKMLTVSMPRRTVLQNVAAAVASMVILSWLRLRPIGIFFLALFFFWIYKTRSNLRIIPPPELQKKYENCIDRVKELRRTRPTMFAILASISLGCLALIGHCCSGSVVVLAGLSIAVVVSTRFTVEKLDPKFARSLNTINYDSEDEDAEFVPEVNTTNLALLERASDVTSHTSPTEDVEDEDRSDDIPSELLIPDSIPEISENSTDEDDDLIPVVNIEKLNADPLTIASKIHFKKGHFKSDSTLSTSSSSSEESLSKGLKFPDHAKIDVAGRSKQPSDIVAAGGSDLASLELRSTTQSLIENSGTLLPNLVAGLMQWGGIKKDSSSGGSSTVDGAAALAITAPQEQDVTLDSSDSEFEFLEKE
ncbi:PREDICTED: uncharacterized protein LOC108368086 [Rhagoletis zephyria]|uniref:uncharacterized protein LOC108368086 n=1 Tax=Rhagoletis zephyria TaxID=28612 RepID=UPI0008116C2A|nr:PREDICTED: uncharacterized protein LOC108368086 [Rhagoletis zephyria]